MIKPFFDIGSRYLLGTGIGALAYFPCTKLSELLNGDKPNLPPNLSMLDRDVKIHCFTIGVLTGPVCEEIVYRGLIQGVVLQKAFVSKCARILPVAGLFAAFHHNKEFAFFLGLELGIIKESKLKLAGSIGAHMANNLLSLKPLLIKEQ